MNTPEAIELAVREYLNQMSPDQLAKSNAYFEGGYWLQLWNFLLSLAIASLMMTFGWSRKMSDLAQRCSRFSFVRSMLYFAQFLLLMTLLSFPLSLYQEYFREHQYGLSNLSFGGWFAEFFKGLVVGLILMSVFGAIIYSVINKFPRKWWVSGALATIAFMMFTSLIAPVYLAPVFNDFKPLRQGEVRESVLALARANGVPVQEVYEFDASKQSKRISANVSGLFNTMRISLNDNLLTRTNLAETRHVMGHEIGHYVLGHVFNHLLAFTLILFAGFFFVNGGMKTFIKSWGDKYQVSSPGDLTGAPVLFALLTVFFFVLTPLNNSIIRFSETQADLFALNTAREPDAAAKVALLLSEYRKISPGWLEEIIFYDHPSGESRIRAAMTWKAENLK